MPDPDPRPNRDAEAPAVSISQALIDQVLPDRVVAALGLAPAFVPLMAEACCAFGIDPNPSKKPRQLLAFRVITGDPDAVPPEAPAVSLVTGGGKKLRYPMDDTTEHVVREIFGAFVVRGGKKEELPLPADLALPLEALDGVVRKSTHLYRGGYLAQGGKAEASQRDRLLDDLRRAGRIR